MKLKSKQSLAAPAKLKWGKRHPRLKLLIIVGSLLLLAMLLTGCEYPGQDPICQGIHAGEPGCTNPIAAAKDDNPGGDWYDQWAFDIVRRFLYGICINSVNLGVSAFWQIFTKLASTDFAGCTSTSTSPTCTVMPVFTLVQSAAYVLMPVLISWKFLKSYSFGSFIEALHESGFSFIPKFILGGGTIFLLPVFISSAFGMSNLLFITILGGTKQLNDMSAAIVGTQYDSGQVDASGNHIIMIGGVYTVQEVQNPGLLMFMTIICLLISLVFILLGLCFFLRTILVFVLFCVSPLAIDAALSDEFKNQFTRWLQFIQSLLVAPIPVAVCLALTKNFLGVLPAAHDDPGNFILQLVYVISFLAIGSLMMFKIAGSTGGAMLSLATAGAAFGAGKLLGNKPIEFAGAGAGAGAGATASLPAPTGERLFEGSRAAMESSPDGAKRSANRNTEAVSSMIGSSAGQSQQQTELVSALRAINANTAASTIGSALATPSSYNPGRSRSRVGPAEFSYRAHDAVQNTISWAAQEAGVSTPTISMAPTRGTGNSSSTGSNSSYYPTRASQPPAAPAARPTANGNNPSSPTEPETPVYAWPSVISPANTGEENVRPSERGGSYSNFGGIEPMPTVPIPTGRVTPEWRPSADVYAPVANTQWSGQTDTANQKQSTNNAPAARKRTMFKNPVSNGFGENSQVPSIKALTSPSQPSA